MTTPIESEQLQTTAETNPADWPPGDHPLEIAARRGLGPLSSLGRENWHGEAIPCVSCGQLVRRGDIECDDCGQDLTPEMIEKMRAHAGPWYVLEHVRPFPGVTLERIVRQIKRGLLTEMSIVRGPATDYQWRFAVETPGLCRYFGRCWQCHDEVGPAETYCRACLSFLGFEKLRAKPVPKKSAPVPSPAPIAPIQSEEVIENQVDEDAVRASALFNVPEVRPVPRVPPTITPRGDSIRVLPSQLGTTILNAAMMNPALNEPIEPATPPSPELRQLSQAIQNMPDFQRSVEIETEPQVFGIRATWIAVMLLILVVAGLLIVTQMRSGATQSPPTGQPDSSVSINSAVPIGG